MSFFVTIVSCFLGCIIIMSKGEKRFFTFMISLLFISSSVVIINKPYVSSHTFFVICFLLSLLNYRQLNSIRRIPFFKMMVFYFISLIVVNINSSFIPLTNGVYKSIMLFLETMMPMVIGYFSGISVSNINKRIYTPLLCILLYGFFTYIFKSDPYQHLLFDDYLEPFHDSYLFGTRMRMSSTWSHPIAYGLICSCFFILLWNKWRENYVKLLLFLLILSVFLCGSRTAIFSIIVMFVIFAHFASNISSSAILGFLPVVIVLYIPVISDNIQSVLDIFLLSESDAVNGSSLVMRQSQLDSVLFLVKEFPIFGGGIGYITDYMKFGTEMSFSSEFLGFESYLFILLIERGFFGTIVEVVFIVYIIRYFLKNRKYEPLSSSIGLSLFIGFYVFAFATSPLDTSIILMFFVGACINDIEIKKNKRLISI